MALEIEITRSANTIDPLKRTEMPPTKVVAPAAASENFGLLVATAMNRPQDADYIEKQFRIQGKFDEWDSYRNNYLAQKDRAAASNIINMAVTRATQLGMTIDDYLISNEEGTKLVQEEAAKFAREKGNPEVAAAIDALTIETTSDPVEQMTLRRNLVEYSQMQGMELQQEMHNELIRMSAGGLEAGGHWETFVGNVVKDMLPYSYPWLLNRVAERTGTKGGWIAYLAPGNFRETLQKDLSKMTIEQRTAIMRDVVEIARNDDSIWTDFQKRDLLTQLFSDNFIYYGALNSNVSEENVYYLMSAVPILGGLLKMAGSGFGLAKRPFAANAIAPVKLINEANKDKSAEILVGLAESTKSGQAKYGMTQSTVTATQVPKLSVFGPDIEDVPESIIKAIEGKETLMEKVRNYWTSSKSHILTDAEKVNAATKFYEDIGVAVGAGRVRTNLSQLKFWEDGNGYTAEVVFGADEKRGFASIKTAIGKAEIYSPDLVGVKIYTSKGGKLVEVGDASVLAKGPNVRGNYYVKVPFERPYGPMDKLASAFGLVEAPTFLGEGTSWVLTPNSIFEKDFYNGVNRVYQQDIAMRSQLQALGSTVQERKFYGNYINLRTVSNMLITAQNYGRKHGRTISYGELRAAHPWATRNQFKYYALERQRLDFMYQLENMHLRNALTRWANDPSNNLIGARTFAANDGSGKFHGGEINLEGLRLLNGYDPATKTGRKISGEKEIAKFRESGGRAIRLMNPFGDGDARWETILIDPKNKDWVLRNMDNDPLPYIHGYIPRIYLDNHFIERTRNVTIDGTSRTITESVATASTPKKAQFVADQMNEKAGWDGTGEAPFRVKVATDSRLSSGDYITAAMDIMRQEGRLFYDDRLKVGLNDGISQAYADTASPLNAINRATSILARNLVVEEYVQGLKTMFKAQYADQLGIKVVNESVETVLNELNKLQPQNKLAAEGYQVWQHIMRLEGVASSNMTMVRKGLIRTAQYVEDIIWKTTGTQPDLIKNVSRNAEKANPFDVAKTLTHTAFIAMRAPKQRVVQTMQHISLLGIDPLYVGRWQKDAFAFNHGIKLYSKALTMGKDHTKAARSVLVKLLGRSEDEVLAALDNYYMQGHRETVNTRAFAGDNRYIDDVPDSWLGATADRLFGLVTLRALRNAGEEVGFIRGEYFNQSASFMLAIRQYGKQVGIDNWTKFSKKDWNEIGALANTYSGAMNRMNAAGYQTGYISAFTQFMQFMHKDLMIMTKAITGLAGEKRAIGPKQITVGQAQRIMAMRFLTMGTAAWGIQEFWAEMFREVAPTAASNPDIMQLFNGITIDWMMDTMMRNLFNDPEIDLDWSEYISPAYNWDQSEIFNVLTKEGIRLNMEDMPLAPFTAVYSRWERTGRLASILMNDTMAEEYTDAQRAEILLNEALASGFGAFSDYLKRRLMVRTGRHVSSAGKPSALSAKEAEAWVALLGVPNQRVDDYWRIVDETTLGSFGAGKYNRSDMQADAKQYVQDVMYLYQQWSKHDPADLAGNKAIVDRILAKTMAMKSIDPSDYDTMAELVESEMEAWQRSNTQGFLMPLETRIKAALETDQIPGNLAEFKAFIATTKAIPEVEKPAILQMIDQNIVDERENNPRLMEQVEQDLEYTKKLAGE